MMKFGVLATILLVATQSCSAARQLRATTTTISGGASGTSSGSVNVGVGADGTTGTVVAAGTSTAKGTSSKTNIDIAGNNGNAQGTVHTAGASTGAGGTTTNSAGLLNLATNAVNPALGFSNGVATGPGSAFTGTTQTTATTAGGRATGSSTVDVASNLGVQGSAGSTSVSVPNLLLSDSRLVASTVDGSSASLTGTSQLTGGTAASTADTNVFTLLRPTNANLQGAANFAGGNGQSTLAGTVTLP